MVQESTMMSADADKKVETPQGCTMMSAGADKKVEIEQRMQNLCWTVSGDYSLRLKLDVEAFERSKYAAL